MKAGRKKIAALEKKAANLKVLLEEERRRWAAMMPAEVPDELGRVYLQATPPRMWRVAPPRRTERSLFDMALEAPPPWARVMHISALRPVQMALKLKNRTVAIWWTWEEAE